MRLIYNQENAFERCTDLHTRPRQIRTTRADDQRAKVPERVVVI